MSLRGWWVGGVDRHVNRAQPGAGLTPPLEAAVRLQFKVNSGSTACSPEGLRAGPALLGQADAGDRAASAQGGHAYTL